MVGNVHSHKVEIWKVVTFYHVSQVHRVSSPNTKKQSTGATCSSITARIERGLKNRDAELSLRSSSQAKRLKSDDFDHLNGLPSSNDDTLSSAKGLDNACQNYKDKVTTNHTKILRKLFDRSKRN